jgi:hypothetical protein
MGVTPGGSIPTGGDVGGDVTETQRDGGMELTVKELWEEALDEQIEHSYSIKLPVVGIEDVETGYRPAYPVTVYQVSGDDTSGIAGMLFPNGDYLEATEQRTRAKYWEFDETLKYDLIPGELTPEGTPRVIGNSWTEGEVVWDGTSGPIQPFVEMVAEIHSHVVQQAKGTMFIQSTKAKVSPHVRLEDFNSLTGEWETYGPNSLRDHRVPGVIHESGTNSKGWRIAPNQLAA